MSDMIWANLFLGHLLEVAEEHERQLDDLASAYVQDDASVPNLRVVRCGAHTYGCRVRRHDKLRYSTQFTLRWAGPDGGGKDELARVLGGWADYLIYGYAPAGDRGPWLEAYAVIDLAVFRTWYERSNAQHGKPPGRAARNIDGTWFKWYELAWLPQGAVVLDRLPDPVQGRLAV